MNESRVRQQNESHNEGNIFYGNQTSRTWDELMSNAEIDGGTGSLVLIAKEGWLKNKGGNLTGGEGSYVYAKKGIDNEALRLKEDQETKEWRYRGSMFGSFMGALSTVSAPRLGATAIKGALEKINLDPKLVDEVLMGNVVQAGVGQAPARQAALYAGLSDAVS